LVPRMTEFPKLIALSGPLKGQAFDVDEKGVRAAEDCIVRLCDGRAVAYSVRDGQERPWFLLEHNTELEIGSSQFRLEHQEYDPNVVLSVFPDFPNEEIESFFLGLLMGKFDRPLAAAVLLDQWTPGETGFATFLPGFFYPRYAIVNKIRRRLVPGIYDETEHVFCARLSQENRYIGALYVKSLTPVPFRPEERAEIVRIATFLSMYIQTREADDMPRKEPIEDGEEEKKRYVISSPAELEVVFEEIAPAYRFGQNDEQPVIEEVPSPLYLLLDDFVFGIFHNISAAVEGAVFFEMPKRPMHFVRLQSPQDFEIDKDVVHRAFILPVDAARNADGTVWAVPIEKGGRRLGVLYAQIDPTVKMKTDFITELKNLADVENDRDFPENLDRYF
jgi:hypothetical protein